MDGWVCEKWVLLGVFVVYGREREVNLFPVMPSPGWNKSLREMKIVLPPKGIEGGGHGNGLEEVNMDPVRDL